MPSESQGSYIAHEDETPGIEESPDTMFEISKVFLQSKHLALPREDSKAIQSLYFLFCVHLTLNTHFPMIVIAGNWFGMAGNPNAHEQRKPCNANKIQANRRLHLHKLGLRVRPVVDTVHISDFIYKHLIWY